MTPLEPYTCNKCKPNTKKIVVELGQDMPPDLHETPNNANNQCEQLCQSTMLPSTHTMAEPARSRPPVLAPSPVVAEVRLKDSTISHCHKKTHNQAFWTPAQTPFPPPRAAIKTSGGHFSARSGHGRLNRSPWGGKGPKKNQKKQQQNSKTTKKQQTSLPTEFLNPTSPPKGCD